MRTFDFGLGVARHIDQYGSDFFMSRLVHSSALHVACMHLPAGGLVGQHRAVSDQLFAVVSGVGWVQGVGEDRVRISAGEAVLWESGELHEAGTETGMTAIVVEAAILSSDSQEIGPLEPPEADQAIER